MKTYIVFVDGNEVGKVKAKSHNAAEKKAYVCFKGRMKTTDEYEQKLRISVEYTEV